MIFNWSRKHTSLSATAIATECKKFIASVRETERESECEREIEREIEREK